MKFSWLTVTFILITITLVWVSSNISWGKDKWKGILESDARGYYAYLPAPFIYNDLNFQFFDSIEKVKYFDEHYYYDYRVSANGKIINKYWCGTAICELPFFLAAHLFTKVSGGDADGYSKLYPIFINLAAIFYLLAGLLFTYRLLGRFGITEWNKTITVVAILFGTNLFYYTIGEPGMSHVYSFALITYFLYSLKCLEERFSMLHIVTLAIVLALIFLTRPQNSMVLLAVPILFSGKKEFISFLKNLFRRKIAIVLAAAVFLAVASIQFIIYKISCGQIFVDSYPGEKFNFSSPHIIDVLFSYKKGLFVYTPLYLASLFGLIYIFRRSRWQFFSFVFFFFVLTYVLSSWHNWWYGGSFSSRVYVDYLVIFSLSLAFALQYSARKIRIAIISVCVFLVLLCQVQTYQYRYNQIHWDKMTKEKYWDVFLRLDKLN